MGIKRVNISAETKAELRRSWIRTILIIFGAFAALAIISVFSEAETSTCTPPAFLCTQPDLERWLGVDLPLSAHEISFESDANTGAVWLTYRAVPLEAAQFLSRMALTTQPETTDEIPADHPDWWNADAAFAPFALGEPANREIRAWVDQSAGDEWTLYLYGRTTANGA